MNDETVKGLLWGWVLLCWGVGFTLSVLFMVEMFQSSGLLYGYLVVVIGLATSFVMGYLPYWLYKKGILV